MKIYLDVCCYNRPFDDQTQDRIRLESEAIIIILFHCLIKNWELIGSKIIDLEISKIPDDNRRERVQILASIVNSKIRVDQKIKNKAFKLEQLNFKSFDALHVACAERKKIDVFLTTDDKLLKNSIRCKKEINIRVENPLKWLMEVL